MNVSSMVTETRILSACSIHAFMPLLLNITHAPALSVIQVDEYMMIYHVRMHVLNWNARLLTGIIGLE